MSEPRPLFFASDEKRPLRDAPVAARPEVGPKALRLPEASDRPSAPGAPVPNQLNLPDTPVRPSGVPSVAPVALFATPEHPALAAAQRAAAALEPEFVARDADRVGRRIRELLPIKDAVLAGFAARPLEVGRELTLAVAALSQRFAALHASELLNQALGSVGGAKRGLLDRVRERLAPTPTDFMPKVAAMQSLLQGLRDELRALRGKAVENDVRLRAHLVALRAVEQVAGPGGAPALHDLAQRKLDVLRAACTQAQLTAAQACQIDQTLAGLGAQCEQLLNVTLSAAALVQAGRGRS